MRSVILFSTLILAACLSPCNDILADGRILWTIRFFFVAYTIMDIVEFFHKVREKK